MRSSGKALYLAAAAGPGMIAAQALAWFYAPVDAAMGITQKIFYCHVPLAWWALAAFLLNALAGAVYLRTREPKWDHLARAAGESGFVLAALAFITGMIWAKCAWGVWWTADPRLITFAVLCFMYAGYLLMRNSNLLGAISGHKRAGLAAVWGILAGLNVPLLLLAARLLRGAHPTVFGARGGGLEPEMLITLLACLLAFGLIWMGILRLRFEQLRLGAALHRLEAGHV